jgi:hypothetical protein
VNIFGRIAHLVRTIVDACSYLIWGTLGLFALYLFCKQGPWNNKPGSAGKATYRPPLNAQFLFYLFLDAKTCDALVGDLEERYRTVLKKFGTRRANSWYWVQVITSLSPFIWAATKRLLKAASGVAAMLEIWRRGRL